MTARILVVDDEPINLITIEGFLSADGYELHFAANGREACAKAHALRPDLILLDVMMPEMDGYAVCRQIRADPAIGRIPIIIVTALHDERSRLDGLRAGADEFLTKPCSRDELRARVSTIVSLNRFRAIAEQRARFEQLYELSPAAIILADENGVILAANRRAGSSFGGPDAAPLPGRTVATCFDASTDAMVRDAIHAAIRGEERPPREVRWRARQTEQTMLLRSASVPDGRRKLVMLVFDDVTAEVQAREALKALNADLETLVRARTQQLEDANTLLMSYASFVSHDLRSPLTVMKGYLGLLNEVVTGMPEEAKPMVAQAHKAANQMAEMVTNILQLAREAHDRPRGAAVPSMDPRPVLERLVSHVKGLAPNPRTVFQVDPLPPVNVSAALLERVFFNLLTNAAKFSADRDVPTVVIGGREDAEGPVLFVRDNGVGFDARDHDRLFREFTRLETAGDTDGLGLGLSLVARLLRAHRGRIWAESEPGEGATFYVLLPHPDREDADPAPVEMVESNLR